VAEARWDGLDGATLRARLAVPELVLLETVRSTMDLAHERAAAGAPSDTLVLADAQESGRGRAGRRWLSPPGRGLWMSLLARPATARGLSVLSVRLGAAAAACLDRFASSRVRLKWPNDLYVDEGKLAGILVESRWREERPEWVVIGFGLNVRVPAIDGAGALREDVDRLEVLEALLPVLRRAAQMEGELTAEELTEWSSRDLAVGRMARQPAQGAVIGVAPDGALLVATANGMARCASGSLVLAEDS
jgi:BirA family transcriptional regulator, biotin operon repressor / biotin---[acetyl-CoA-carboxylase] ligase